MTRRSLQGLQLRARAALHLLLVHLSDDVMFSIRASRRVQLLHFQPLAFSVGAIAPRH